MAKLDRMAELQDGWNSYAAPRPHERAIGAAKSFVQAMGSLDYPPKRVAPSAVGGVAVSRRVGALNALVEFYNDGRIFVMFSDGVGEPDIREVKPSLDSFKAIIDEMRTFLDE